ncbi:U2 small nuclear ribonucleoprotein auxiliary factor 35 kDa subunit-related protein 1 [Aricia agestis]|uniref:U2 small nuclear ribonucleoprotein auxiliary factor 35 kDa subunit-related protein 1 n=1 Tax=Aricia agestis TaxID=91739 RepID=UPI001C204195|nr:U2 small nuclear ribonucleoprotein auxiliary factor 35 kDa subunit-related protein 1 [Aricia agestis]
MANMKEKHDRSTPSNHHWKILKCRMIIFSTSSILACPDKSDEKQLHIVFNQHGRDFDTLMSLFSKFSLQQVGNINKVTKEMFATCFRYTMTARMAPIWNVLGYNYMINNRDFLTATGPQNGIQLFLNSNGDSINMKINPVKIHVIKPDEPFLPEEYVRVLPSLNKAIIKERFESLLTGGDFKSYKDLRRHWKNVHGYRLPDTECSSYYSLQFWRGEPLIYPDICLTRAFPIITPLPKSTGVTLASAFVETLVNKMPYNVRKSPSQFKETVNVSRDENDNFLRTQAVSLCTPSQSQRIQREGILKNQNRRKYVKKMGKHKEWRRIAKRERRRRIRTTIAKHKDNISLTLPKEEYERWKEEQIALEKFELNQIKESNQREHEKWLKAEKIALENWSKLQEKLAYMKKTQLEMQAKLNLELEMERQQKEKERQRIKEIEEENKRKQEQFIKNLETFLNDKGDPPRELLVYHESKPNCDDCPFFLKTACCRFGDECSRNHKYPGISKILLATNMFSHFGLENTNVNEYDTDITLEFEESDTYRDFKEFFYDILPEFRKFGTVVQLKVCNNHEKHLRGNTYIEYADLRSSVAAYRTLHGRWYGGKQLTLQFCEIKSWKNAICGLQSRKRCPKGNSCNFLHVFRNPGKHFQDEYYESRTTPSSSRSWRWSKSPEREPSPHDKHKKNKHSRECNSRRSTRSEHSKRNKYRC